jgi:hypothetical protein
MTQLLDTEGPYACIWDDDLPCEITLIDVDRPATDQELMEFVFNNDFPPIAPVPIGSSGLLLVSAVIIALAYKRMLT